MKKFEMVIEKVMKMIEVKQIVQGQRLPSIRQLAELHNLNKSTIIRAYKELEENHVIYSIPKGGYYLVGEKISLTDEDLAIDFSIARPDEKLLPYREFGHCFSKAINRYQHVVFEETNPAGLGALRETLVDHLRHQQVYTKRENLFVTSGTQQAMSLLTQMPFPSGATGILVEEPGYNTIIEVAQLYNRELYTIERTYEGIDLKKLESLFSSQKIKFFFTMPRFQNPLGTCYTEKVKQKIVALAVKYDVYIVEDDCIIDLDANKKCMSLHYYDTNERVLYLKSFSKSFIPGLRLGLVLLPSELQDTFLKYKECADLCTSVPNQGALDIFIRSGLYDKHCDRIQSAYFKKMSLLKSFLKNHPKIGVSLKIPRSGIYIWLIVDDDVNSTVLYENLRKKRILIKNGRQYFVNKERYNNSIRLCIFNTDDEALKTGISIILKEIERLKNASQITTG